MPRSVSRPRGGAASRAVAAGSSVVPELAVAQSALKAILGHKGTPKAPKGTPKAPPPPSDGSTVTFEAPTFILRKGSVRSRKIHGKQVLIVHQPQGLTAKEGAIVGLGAAAVVGAYYAGKALGRGWHDLLQFGKWFDNAAATAVYAVQPIHTKVIPTPSWVKKLQGGQ